MTSCCSRLIQPARQRRINDNGFTKANPTALEHGIEAKLESLEELELTVNQEIANESGFSTLRVVTV